MKRAAFAAPLLFIAALSGCASSLSGVGGAGGYVCKAPAGALCTSVSGVYANSLHGQPKPTTPPEPKTTLATPAPYGATALAPARLTAVPDATLRSNPRVLRLWIAPWEDADGDLHEESFVHVLVDPGRWLIEHVRPAWRPRLDGVAPPASPAPEPAPAKTPSETPPAPTRFPLPPAGLSSDAELVPTER